VRLGDLGLVHERVRVDADVVGGELLPRKTVEGEVGGVPAGESLRHHVTAMSSTPRDRSTQARSSAISEMTLVW
jgi:hypothetical protein